LRGTDQQGQAAGRAEQVGGNGQDGLEALDGTERHYVEGVGGEGFGAGGLYIDVRQCKGAGDFTEEGGFLVVGFNQSQADRRTPELYGNAWEACAGAYVGNSNILHHSGHRGHRGSRKQVAGGEEALAEVAGDDFFGVTDGGEVDAGIPAEKYIDVRRYIMQVVGR
jgi:hypothetical protein